MPRDEARRFADQVKERKVGELFANFKGYDVQEVRRIAREEGEKAGKKAGEKKGLAALVRSLKVFLPDFENVYNAVIKNEEYAGCTREEVMKYY